ncbi:MAG TPA: lipid II flippase MurJ, partial [Ignavibacteriaceae bacterium]|nr:lipid II flippase MurJ [Ignavibacteriaceae bacterium]
MKLNLSSSLAGASLILIAYNIVGKGLGLIRESLYAALFGLQVEFDLYLVGAVIPTIINSIIQYIGQNYFIPAFSKVSDEESTKFLKNILYVFFISASIVTILLYISSSTIISSYLSGNSIEISELALNVFRIFILVIPINALIAVLSAYFQAKYKFVTPVASQLLFNLTILVFVFVFYAKLGIYSIPFGFLVSMLFQLIYLYAKIEKSVRRKLVFENNSFDLVKNIPAGLGIIFFIEISGQLFILIDRYFLSQVDSGGISALNYANTLFILPIS